MKRILLAGAAVAAMTSASFAADYALEQVDVWTGWYGGIQGGYAFSGDATATGFGTTDFEGGFAGVYYGRNWQSGDWVFGLDGSISFSGIEADGLPAGTDAELKAFSANRLRVGYAFDNVLVFAAVGGSIGRLEVETGGVSDDDWLLGFTVGGGVDFKVSDSWSARVEYLYVDYRDEDFNVGGIVNVDIDDVHMVRGGFAYHF